jgi:glutamate dehydrogenase
MLDEIADPVVHLRERRRTRCSSARTTSAGSSRALVYIPRTATTLPSGNAWRRSCSRPFGGDERRLHHPRLESALAQVHFVVRGRAGTGGPSTSRPRSLEIADATRTWDEDLLE